MAVELPTIATRLPAGSGWWASSVPTSNICATVSTRITPAEANSAATDCSGTATEVPASPRVTFTCRPLFTATTGLVRPTLRASRANLRGLPKLSRCSRTTSVPGSVAQYWSRSLPLTSARLPAETKVDSPRSRLRARSSSATPSDAGLGEEPDPPAAGDHRRQAGVEPHLGVGVDDAEAVRARPRACPRPGRRRPAAARPRGPPARSRRTRRRPRPARAPACAGRPRPRRPPRRPARRGRRGRRRRGSTRCRRRPARRGRAGRRGSPGRPARRSRSRAGAGAARCRSCPRRCWRRRRRPTTGVSSRAIDRDSLRCSRS